MYIYEKLLIQQLVASCSILLTLSIRTQKIFIIYRLYYLSKYNFSNKQKDIWKSITFFPDTSIDEIDSTKDLATNK